MQTAGEVDGGGAGQKVAVGIVPGRQHNQACSEASTFQMAGEPVSSLLAGLIVVVIEGNVDQTARQLAKLSHLGGRQMGADGAGNGCGSRLDRAHAR